MKKIKDACRNAVKNNHLFRGWEIVCRKTRSLQRLYENRSNRLFCHQNRDVNDTHYSLIVYYMHNKENTGIASADLVLHEPLTDQIQKALASAGSNFNQSWPFPEPPQGKYRPVKLCDPLIKKKYETVADNLEKRAQNCLNLPGIHVNSAELYLNYHEIERLTHTGIYTKKEKSDIYFESAMESSAGLGENNQEIHERTAGVTAAGFNIETFFSGCADLVNSLGATSEPPNLQNASLVINHEALAEIISALLTRLTASAEYNKHPFFSKGNLISSCESAAGSDMLEITLDPYIDFMAESTPWTHDGQIAEKACVIKNNIVQARLSDVRYASYLGLSPSCITGNIIIPAGKTPELELLHDNVLEIIKFSSLLIDEKKLTWSSEIKLGRLYENGKIRLVKGGVVSGNIKDNFSDFIMSCETAVFNFPGDGYHPPLGYCGPKKVLFRRGVSVAGREKQP
ncbi:MAG: hypothetical protein A2096_14020 [Spirochaetes bacterium GWF1_41_5]|nr:MAG: hypothetical protein A2096_14020 [Spirochaetes bacterium GWF1_41_5]HBE01332.1 hypothetical protein [Spirochaetia bacterium]